MNLHTIHTVSARIASTSSTISRFFCSIVFSSPYDPHLYVRTYVLYLQL